MKAVGQARLSDSGGSTRDQLQPFPCNLPTPLGIDNDGSILRASNWVCLSLFALCMTIPSHSTTKIRHYNQQGCILEEILMFLWLVC